MPEPMGSVKIIGMVFKYLKNTADEITSRISGVFHD
jgi:hypothetical protein